MSEALQTGFLLLAVGMITVFTVLAIVVVMGRALIATVNRFSPDAPVERPSPKRIASKSSATHSEIHKKKLAAVVAATLIATGGKGEITRIEKTDP